MRIDRDIEPQRLLERDVLGCVVEVLLTAQDMGDTHERIVNDDGEVVGGEAVLLADD